MNVDTVTISTEKYTELLTARIGIEMIYQSRGKYCFDTTVVRTILLQLGYEIAEED